MLFPSGANIRRLHPGIFLGLLFPMFCVVLQPVVATTPDTPDIPDAGKPVPGSLVPADGLGVRMLESR